jgi:hypothetical protein
LASPFAEKLEPKIREYVEEFRKLEREGVDTRALYLEGIKTVIGETGTSAMVFYIGDKALLDPGTFVRRLVQIFGEGGFVFLDGMIAQAASHQKSRSWHGIKQNKGRS